MRTSDTQWTTKPTTSEIYKFTFRKSKEKQKEKLKTKHWVVSFSSTVGPHALDLPLQPVTASLEKTGSKPSQSSFAECLVNIMMKEKTMKPLQSSHQTQETPAGKKEKCFLQRYEISTGGQQRHQQEEEFPFRRPSALTQPTLLSVEASSFIFLRNFFYQSLILKVFASVSSQKPVV